MALEVQSTYHLLLDMVGGAGSGTILYVHKLPSHLERMADIRPTRRWNSHVLASIAVMSENRDTVYTTRTGMPVAAKIILADEKKRKYKYPVRRATIVNCKLCKTVSTLSVSSPDPRIPMNHLVCVYRVCMYVLYVAVQRLSVE